MLTLNRFGLPAGAMIAVGCLQAQAPATRESYEASMRACEAATAAAMAPLKVETACSMTDADVAAITKRWADARMKVCNEDPSFFSDLAVEIRRIRRTRDTLCEKQKGGPNSLPPFEAALYAMTDARRLPPCAYDPKQDYSAVVNDPQYQTFNSRTAYNNGMTFRRFELYVSEADQASKECFLGLIKARLKGAEWKPRAHASSDRRP